MGAYLRRAEDLGFESAMLIDHLLVAPPAYRVTWLEPISLLRALAGVTRTIRLGTLVLVLPFRDPVAFAKEWATLDQLSGGRSILGVGVGWNKEEFAALRIPIEERGRRMNEMLEAITALWAGDDVSYEGKYYRFEHLTIEPKPAQKPHPPIWIGGGTQPSEKIYGQGVDTIQPVLRRIAKYASTWVPHSSATAEMVAGDWANIRGYMVENGRDPDDMRRVYSNFVHILAPGEKPESAAAKFRVYSGHGPAVLAGVLPARRGRGGGRADPRQDRGARRRRPPDPQPARLGSGVDRGARRARPAARRRRSGGPARRGASCDRPGLDDALGALASGGPGGAPWVVVAGATDHYPARVGRAPVEDVLDVTAIAGLRGVAARSTAAGGSAR